MTDLASCPFCGSSNVRVYEVTAEFHCVTCDGCNAEGGYLSANDSQSPDEAIAAWNRRAIMADRAGRGWRSIDTADKSLIVRVMLPGVPASRHSYPIWCRFEKGEPFEASWVVMDNGKSYWWAWDLEDIMDPDEWLPHPLEPLPLPPVEQR